MDKREATFYKNEVMSRTQRELLACLNKGEHYTNSIGYLVDIPGPEAASQQLQNVVDLLSTVVNGTRDQLYHAMQISVHSLDHLNGLIEGREFSCASLCTCMNEGSAPRISLPNYFAGCHFCTTKSGRATSGLVYDVARIMRENWLRETRPPSFALP